MSVLRWYQCGHCPASFNDRFSLPSHDDGHRKNAAKKTPPTGQPDMRGASRLSLEVDSDGTCYDGNEDNIRTADDERVDNDDDNNNDEDNDDGPATKMPRFTLVSDDGEYRIPISQERVVKFVNIVKESRRRKKREEAALATFKRLYDYEPQSLFERRMIVDWSEDSDDSRSPLKVLDVRKIKSRNVMLTDAEKPTFLRTNDDSLRIVGARKISRQPQQQLRIDLEPKVVKRYEPSLASNLRKVAEMTNDVPRVAGTPAGLSSESVESTLSSSSPSSPPFPPEVTTLPANATAPAVKSRVAAMSADTADSADVSAEREDEDVVYLQTVPSLVDFPTDDVPGVMRNYADVKSRYLAKLNLPIDSVTTGDDAPRRINKHWQSFLKYAQDLTAEEIKMLRDRCFREVVKTSSGHMFRAANGRPNGRPPAVRFVLRNEKFCLYRRHLSLFLRLWDELGRAPEWPQYEMTCVSLCEEKLSCIAPNHLSLESPARASDRSSCKDSKYCKGHGDDPLFMSIYCGMNFVHFDDEIIDDESDDDDCSALLSVDCDEADDDDNDDENNDDNNGNNNDNTNDNNGNAPGPSPPKRSKFSLVSDDGEYVIPMSDENVAKFVNVVAETRLRKRKADKALAKFKRLYDYEPRSLFEERMIVEWSEKSKWERFYYPLKVLDASKIVNRNVVVNNVGKDRQLLIQSSKDDATRVAPMAPKPLPVVPDYRERNSAGMSLVQALAVAAKVMPNKNRENEQPERPTTPELYKAATIPFYSVRTSIPPLSALDHPHKLKHTSVPDGEVDESPITPSGVGAAMPPRVSMPTSSLSTVVPTYTKESSLSTPSFAVNRGETDQESAFSSSSSSVFKRSRVTAMTRETPAASSDLKPDVIELDAISGDTGAGSKDVPGSLSDCAVKRNNFVESHKRTLGVVDEEFGDAYFSSPGTKTVPAILRKYKGTIVSRVDTRRWISLSPKTSTATARNISSVNEATSISSPTAVSASAKELLKTAIGAGVVSASSGTLPSLSSHPGKKPLTLLSVRAKQPSISLSSSSANETGLNKKPATSLSSTVDRSRVSAVTTQNQSIPKNIDDCDILTEPNKEPAFKRSRVAAMITIDQSKTSNSDTNCEILTEHDIAPTSSSSLCAFEQSRVSSMAILSSNNDHCTILTEPNKKSASSSASCTFKQSQVSTLVNLSSNDDDDCDVLTTSFTSAAKHVDKSVTPLTPDLSEQQSGSSVSNPADLPPYYEQIRMEYLKSLDLTKPSFNVSRTYLRMMTEFVEVAPTLINLELEMLRQRCYETFVKTPSGHVMPEMKMRTHRLTQKPTVKVNIRGIPYRFVALGCDPLNKGYLGVYELSRGAIQIVREEENPTAFRCATFGATSLEERHLTTGDFAGRLQTWDLERLDNPVTTVQAHREILNCVDGAGLCDGGSRTIATGSKDGSVTLWDARDMSKATASIGPKEGEIRQDCWSVAFGGGRLQDDRLLATGYDNGDLKLFDLRQMSVLWERNVKHGICSIEFDGAVPAKRLVATSTNAKIHVCDLSQPDSMRSESGHKSTVWCASHLPQNPDVFMTTGGNGNLNLWRVNHDVAASGGNNVTSKSKAKSVELLNTTSISSEPVCRFSWHPDKTGLGLATSFDRTLRMVIVTRLSTAS